MTDLAHCYPLWGYSLTEYVQMFDLKQTDLKRKILDFGGSGSSFNEQMTKQGFDVTSSDELYKKPKSFLNKILDEANQQLLAYVEENPDKFNWGWIVDMDDLNKRRSEAVERFLDDFNNGVEAKRYVDDCGPMLHSKKHQFELTVASHYFFNGHLSDDPQFYIDTALKLMRISAELRIFPLVDYLGRLSPYLQPVMLALQEKNFGVEVREVAFDFQKGGNAMLRIWSQECPL